MSVFYGDFMTAIQSIDPSSQAYIENRDSIDNTRPNQNKEQKTAPSFLASVGATFTFWVVTRRFVNTLPIATENNPEFMKGAIQGALGGAIVLATKGGKLVKAHPAIGVGALVFAVLMLGSSFLRASKRKVSQQISTATKTNSDMKIVTRELKEENVILEGNIENLHKETENHTKTTAAIINETNKKIIAPINQTADRIETATQVQSKTNLLIEKTNPKLDSISQQLNSIVAKLEEKNSKELEKYEKKILVYEEKDKKSQIRIAELEKELKELKNKQSKTENNTLRSQNKK